MTVSAASVRQQIRPSSFVRRRWPFGISRAVEEAMPQARLVRRCPPPSLGARGFSSSQSVARATHSFRWLDLEGSGLSMVERLTLEEALLKHTRDNWILVGRHAVWPPKHIAIPQRSSSSGNDTISKEHKKILHKAVPDYIEDEPNPHGMIVMGIGGKAEKLLNAQSVIDDQLLVVKRFSGGGTVVMDENAIWTTLIAGRRGDDGDDDENREPLCKPYPRDIMKWTADAVFAPAFDLLNANQERINTDNNRSSNSNTELAPKPRFSLKEDDYVLTLGDEETRKMGGNAQAITGKQGWLHHTSFLWDYEDVNMERYLKLPEKRPDYRIDRSHRDFLVRLREHYDGENGPSVFAEAMKEASQNSLDIQETDWQSVYKEVFGNSNVKMNEWWLENRTRIQHEL